MKILTNEELLDVIRESFQSYLAVGTSRSTAKLKSLHGKIAADLGELFGPEYIIQSQGYGDDKEGCLDGRYYPKNVDIAISKNGKPVAGYAIKFVMRNYLQNSNNYFENMLGETANLKANSIPYFQIFIIFDKLPYYKSRGELHKWDIITQHNLDKYVKLSYDDPKTSCHVPDKTLLILLTLKEPTDGVVLTNDKEYMAHYSGRIKELDLISYSEKIDNVFGEAVILNDYDKFLAKTVEISRN